MRSRFRIWHLLVVMCFVALVLREYSSRRSEEAFLNDFENYGEESGATILVAIKRNDLFQTLFGVGYVSELWIGPSKSDSEVSLSQLELLGRLSSLRRLSLQNVRAQKRNSAIGQAYKMRLEHIHFEGVLCEDVVSTLTFVTNIPRQRLVLDASDFDATDTDCDNRLRTLGIVFEMPR
jgi:hypothetical protein